MSDKKDVAIYQEPPAEVFALDYDSEDNDRSLINIIDEEIIREKLALEKVQDLLSHDENALRKIVKPSVVVNRLRNGFWTEYNLAQSNKTKMNLDNIYKGICSKQNFYKIIRKDASIAWILMPVADYHIALTEAHSFGIDRLREILNMPLYKKVERKNRAGAKSPSRMVSEPDIRMAQLQVKVFELLDNRVKGAIVQKIHQHNTGVVEKKEEKVVKEVDLSKLSQEELGEMMTSDLPDIKIK